MVRHAEQSKVTFDPADNYQFNDPEPIHPGQDAVYTVGEQAAKLGSRLKRSG